MALKTLTASWKTKQLVSKGAFVDVREGCNGFGNARMMLVEGMLKLKWGPQKTRVSLITTSRKREIMAEEGSIVITFLA